MPHDREQQRQSGRLGAHVLHSMYDSRELTKNARAAFRAKFEWQVDPDGVLVPAERARRAEHAYKAYMTSLSLKGRRAQAQKRAAS